MIKSSLCPLGYEGTFSVIRWERTLVIFSVIAFYIGGLKGFFAGDEQVFIIKGTKAVPKKKISRTTQNAK